MKSSILVIPRLPVLLGLLFLLPVSGTAEDRSDPLPDWITFPESDWERITPEQAGLDSRKFEKILEENPVRAGSWGGVPFGENDYGAVLTRGGYLIYTWGNPDYKCQSASLGKCLTKVLVGLTVEAGLLDLDEPIWKTWDGHGQLAHPHKYLDSGHHRNLTWRRLLNHEGGFVLESGYHWRRKTLFHEILPVGVHWTGDPDFDNFAQLPPGREVRYSSGGYWRLGQALTALWHDDLKNVLQRRLFDELGIPEDRWDWLPGRVVRETVDFYPDFPGYGEYVDPPYEIDGHIVRGAPGWFVLTPIDLARFGLLVATGGVWKEKRLVGTEWLQGHAGLDIHVVAGDPASFVSVAKINCQSFPFGGDVGTKGRFRFPPELVTGPVRPASDQDARKSD